MNLLSAGSVAGKHGIFPPPLKLGPKTYRWRLSDVEDFLNANPEFPGGGTP